MNVSSFDNVYNIFQKSQVQSIFMAVGKNTKVNSNFLYNARTTQSVIMNIMYY